MTAFSLEAIAEKVRQRRELRNLKGEPIKLDNQQLCIVRYTCGQGLMHKQIELEIGIDKRQISRHLASAMRVIGAKTHGQLGAWAAKAGIV